MMPLLQESLLEHLVSNLVVSLLTNRQDQCRIRAFTTLASCLLEQSESLTEFPFRAYPLQIMSCMIPGSWGCGRLFATYPHTLKQTSEKHHDAWGKEVPQCSDSVKAIANNLRRCDVCSPSRGFIPRAVGFEAFG